MTVSGDPLFTFAVVADTHMRPEEGDESSPFPVNEMANDRARYVVSLLNDLKPDFIIHLGDIVHPVPVLPTYGAACEAAKAALGRLDAPIRYIPGNHDVGDKPNPQMPAAGISDANMDAYEAEFGETWSSFDKDDCHFTLLNAQLMNSGLAREKAQADWLERDLAANSQKRVFVFIHYPPCIRAEDEASNYDNIDEPVRSWLLALIKKHSVEAMFCGHVHGFFYNRHGDAESYILPSTSFFRQDYSELFRIEAADQHGRNDAEKLGFFMVGVYSDGHVARLIRTNGETLALGAPEPQWPARIRTLHSKEATGAAIGVHLRHPWAEETELPYNGPMDEFHRKCVRNDYTLMVLWELGIRKVRVPISELSVPRIRDRIATLCQLGHQFDVFSFGVPEGDFRDAFLANQALVNSIEIIVPWGDAIKTLPALQDLKNAADVPVILTKIETSADNKAAGSKFSHFVAHGFRRSEIEQIDEFTKSAGTAGTAVDGLIDGYVFRIALDRSPWEDVQELHRLAKARGFKAIANIRLASENPAEYVTDDRILANQIAEAVLAGYAFDDVEVFIDTFMDLDRGYFPRHGLVDRRFNPRPASFVFKYLQSLLLQNGPKVTLGARREAAGGSVCEFEIGAKTGYLLLPSAATMDIGAAGVPRPVTAFNLLSGVCGSESDVVGDGAEGPTLLLAD
jgi:predicted phosphodiesterase